MNDYDIFLIFESERLFASLSNQWIWDHLKFKLKRIYFNIHYHFCPKNISSIDKGQSTILSSNLNQVLLVLNVAVMTQSTALVAATITEQKKQLHQVPASYQHTQSRDVTGCQPFDQGESRIWIVYPITEEEA